MIEQTKPVASTQPDPKFASIPSHLKTTADEEGNVLIEGSIFANPHVVAALVGTKSVACETKALGEELQFTIKLGVTKSIHDVKPTLPPSNTATVPANPPKPAGAANVVTPKPPIPAQPAK